MAIPAAAAAAYQNAARMAQTPAQPDIAPTDHANGSFGDFLSGAVKDSIATLGRARPPPPPRSPARPISWMWSIR